MPVTHSTTPTATIEEGGNDELKGWDSSAGRDVFFPAGTAASKDTGPALTQVPTGQNLQDGGAAEVNRIPIRGRYLSNWVVNHHYIALLKKDSTVRAISGSIYGGGTGGIGSRGAVLEFTANQDGAGNRACGYRAINVFSGFVLVEFDADGATWIGLRTKDTQTIGNRGFRGAHFWGSIEENFNWDDFRTFDVADVSNEQPYSGLSAVFSGAPGDSTGDNGPWYNPNQSLGDASALSQGSDTQSGNGAATTFNLAHGLGGIPTSYNVTAASSAAADKFWVSGVDGTNITLEYAAAPASATDNLSWSFQAYREA